MMAEISAIGPVGIAASLASAVPVQMPQAAVPNALAAMPQAAAGDFAGIVSQGLARMDAKVAHADRMVARFAVDDSVPVHQVTIALEEARLSVELAMQVRQRFVEGYRELMNMQL